MTKFEYYVHHAIPTGWQTIRGAFIAWRDLVSGNWDGYALLDDEDPFQECYGWFWQLLGEDNVYPKAFLEHLQELVQKIDNGDEVLISYEIESTVKELYDGPI